MYIQKHVHVEGDHDASRSVTVRDVLRHGPAECLGKVWVRVHSACGRECVCVCVRERESLWLSLSTPLIHCPQIEEASRQDNLTRRVRVELSLTNSRVIYSQFVRRSLSV